MRFAFSNVEIPGVQAAFAPQHPPGIYVFIRAAMETDAVDAGLAFLLWLLERAASAHEIMLPTSEFLLQIGTDRLEGHGDIRTQYQFLRQELGSQLI